MGVWADPSVGHHRLIGNGNLSCIFEIRVKTSGVSEVTYRQFQSIAKIDKP